MNWRKGFYFSFDAFMALVVMSAALVVVGQSSDISTNTFKVTSINYQRANSIGQDAMKMSSIQKYSYFNESYQDELVANTQMAEEDLDRNIVDGVSLLWAARNFTYAEEVAKLYFDTKIPEGYDYRLQVNEGDTTTVIYESEPMPESPEFVSSISRLVSGHKIDRPSEGFQARARAVKARTNQTKVVNIPMMGSGGTNLNLDLEKKFDINASEIHSAKIYFSAHWGESNFQSNTVELNGQDLDIGGSQSTDWDHYAEKGGTTLGYDTADITSEVQNGWNTFHLNFNNQNNHHVHIHPGTRIEVRYSGENQLNVGGDREYFTDITGQGSNSNKRGGAWITKPFFIPENATVENVSLRLNVQNVRDVADRSDVTVYLNKDRVHAQNLSGSDIIELDLTDNATKGNNVLSAYVNTFVENGEVDGFGGYPENPTIYSDPENDPENSSSLLVDYESPNTGIVYNKLEVVSSKEVGGSPSNPKSFQEDFEEGVNLINTFVNLAQLDSRNVTFEAGSGSLNSFFVSPREYATPTKVGVDNDLIEDGAVNEFRISEECSVECSILPETSIETHVMVSSQVGYGDLFTSQSAAVDDAELRLEEQLGQYADATNIDTGTISTGNQPYLWGPASIKLVIWRE